VRNFFALWYKQETAGFLRSIWAKYRLVIFQTPQISLAAAAARDILVILEYHSRYLSQIPLETVLFPILLPAITNDLLQGRCMFVCLKPRLKLKPR